MRRLNEELRFLDGLVRCFLRCSRFLLRAVNAEEVARELSFREGVVKDLRLVKVRPELRHDVVRFIAYLVTKVAHQRFRRREHGTERQTRSFLCVAFIEPHLRGKDLLFAGLKAKLHERHNLTGTLPNADITDGVYARIAPIRVVAGVFLEGGNLHDLSKQSANLRLPYPLDKVLEGFFFLALSNIVVGDDRHSLWNALGGNRSDGKAVGAGVLRPLSPEHNLKVGHAAPAHVAAYA